MVGVGGPAGYHGGGHDLGSLRGHIFGLQPGVFSDAVVALHV